MKKPNFADKTKAIIGKTPKIENLNDFLGESSDSISPKNHADTKEVEIFNKKVNEIELEEKIQPSISGQKISREEFRLNYELAERLRFAAFSIKKNKTLIVKEALEEYLDKMGF